MRLTLVQVLMNGRGLAMNPMQSLYYVSPACLVSLLVPFGERRGAARRAAGAGATGGVGRQLRGPWRRTVAARGAGAAFY
jgi:hypothetical protein